MQEGHIVHDAWFKVVDDGGERFVKISQSGRGVSDSALGEGEKSVLTIDVRGEKPVTSAFACFVEEYERAAVLGHVFHELALAHPGDDTPANVNQDPSIAARLRRSLNACAPSYNEDQVHEFRKWLKSTVQFVQVLGHSVPLVTPAHLVEFSRHLAALRAAYAADSILFGSIATASQICVHLPAEVIASDTPERRGMFRNLALRLVAGDEFHPVRIANDVIQQAINAGLLGPLLDLADGYFQSARAGIRAAQSCNSFTDFLDKLYETVPRANGSVLIYARLVENSTRLTPEQAALARSRLTMADEENVRLASAVAFYDQLSDFDGKQWEFYSRGLREILNTRGEEAARNAIKDMVQVLAYPTQVANELFRDADWSRRDALLESDASGAQQLA